MKFVVSYNKRGSETIGMIEQIIVEADSLQEVSQFMDQRVPNYDGRSIMALDSLLLHPIVAEAVYDPKVVAISKLANVEIAAEDYNVGGKEVDGKHYFTHDEALDVQEKLKDAGWRLPTRSEWVLICEEFGQKDGQLDAQTLYKNLNMGLTGFYDFEIGKVHSRTTYGHWWSATRSSATSAYSLYTTTTGVYPQYSYYRGYGLAVRLVRDVKGSE